MGNEFTGFEDNAPTLTLGTRFGEPKAEAAAEPEAEAVKNRKWNNRSLPGRTADGRQLC